MCPECGAPVPVLPGYPDWCDRCGWNLKAPPQLEPLVARVDHEVLDAHRGRLYTG